MSIFGVYLRKSVKTKKNLLMHVIVMHIIMHDTLIFYTIHRIRPPKDISYINVKAIIVLE
jgi:hypothetical protein